MHDIVYHYTSPDGIFNILRDKTLWFTDCQYLNDLGEFIYLKEPFKEAYEKITKERSKKSENMFDFIESLFSSPFEDMGIKAIDNQLDTSKKTIRFKYHRYYVLCTSINSDTSSMWNYYVKNGVFRGYNLGIDRDFIKELFSHLCYRNKQIDFIEEKVVYNKNKQIEMIYNKLNELFNQYDDREKLIKGDWEHHELNIDTFKGELFDYVSELKLFFKTPALSSEEEYRFILKVDNDFEGDEDLSLKFRVGESGIITPYIVWKYTLNEKKELFKQITLAPMIESNLAEESFKRFLTTTVYKNIRIKPSSIKLRF